MRKVVLFLVALTIPASAGEVSRYLKFPINGKEFKPPVRFKTDRSTQKVKEEVGERNYTATLKDSWTDLGRVVGKVNGYLIILTKKGKYVIRKDYR